MSTIDRLSSDLLSIFLKDDIIAEEMDEFLSCENQVKDHEYIFYYNEKIIKAIESKSNIIFINCEVLADVKSKKSIALINSVAKSKIEAIGNIFVGRNSYLSKAKCEKVFYTLPKENLCFVDLEARKLEFIVADEYQKYRNINLKFDSCKCNFTILIPRQINTIHLKRNCYFTGIRFLTNHDGNKVYLGESSAVSYLENGKIFLLSDKND